MERCCGEFRKERIRFRNQGGTLSSSPFDWKKKVSIYILKLGFSGLFRGLWKFPRFSRGLETRLRMNPCPMRTLASQTLIPNSSGRSTLNGHSSLNINPNCEIFMFKLKPKMSIFQ